MKHQFIPSAIALKLKDIGYDEPCLAYYLPAPKWMLTSELLQAKIIDGKYILKLKTNHFGDIDVSTVKNSDYKKVTDNIAAPLFQQVLDYFRIKHKLIGMINTTIYSATDYQVVIITEQNERFLGKIYQDFREAEIECINMMIKIII